MREITITVADINNVAKEELYALKVQNAALLRMLAEVEQQLAELQERGRAYQPGVPLSPDG